MENFSRPEHQISTIKIDGNTAADLEAITAHLGLFTKDAILICEAENSELGGPRIIWCNEAFLRTSGYNREEVIGATPRILQGPGTSEVARSNIRKKLQRWQPVVQELLNYRKDGTTFWSELSIVPVCDSTGWYHYWVSFQRDITDRKEHELELLVAREELKRSHEALETMHERYEVAIRGSSVGLWDWDTRTDELFWSPRFMEIVGVSENKFQPQLSEFVDRLHDQDRDRVLGAINAHLEDHTPYSVDYRLRREDGDYIWIHARGQAIWDKDGSPLRMAGSVEDISVRVRIEKALRVEREALLEAKLQAEAGQRAKNEFLANMSHEIRTPLNCIIGMTQLLQEPGFEDQQADYFQAIQQSGETLLEILNNVLELSQKQAEQSPSPSVTFSLSRMIDDLNQIFGTKARNKGLFFEIEYKRPIVDLRQGQYANLMQIMHNLLGNALKFTDKGGIIVVFGTSQQDGCWMDIAILDTGIGIPEEMIDPIFSAFSQVDGSFNRRHEGAGLGLAITKKLVESMGGIINVKSTLGEGSVFQFSLPLPYADLAEDDPSEAE